MAHRQQQTESIKRPTPGTTVRSGRNRDAEVMSSVSEFVAGKRGRQGRWFAVVGRLFVAIADLEKRRLAVGTAQDLDGDRTVFLFCVSGGNQQSGQTGDGTYRVVFFRETFLEMGFRR